MAVINEKQHRVAMNFSSRYNSYYASNSSFQAKRAQIIIIERPSLHDTDLYRSRARISSLSRIAFRTRSYILTCSDRVLRLWIGTLLVSSACGNSSGFITNKHLRSLCKKRVSRERKYDTNMPGRDPNPQPRCWMRAKRFDMRSCFFDKFKKKQNQSILLSIIITLIHAKTRQKNAFSRWAIANLRKPHEILPRNETKLCLEEGNKKMKIDDVILTLRNLVSVTFSLSTERCGRGEERRGRCANETERDEEACSSFESRDDKNRRCVGHCRYPLRNNRDNEKATQSKTVSLSAPALSLFFSFSLTPFFFTRTSTCKSARMFSLSFSRSAFVVLEPTATSIALVIGNCKKLTIVSRARV